MDEITNLKDLIDKVAKERNISVSIFMGGLGTTVTIQPYPDEHKPVWKTEERGDMLCDRYICSECGSASRYPTPYCPYCGEKLTQEERL